MNYYIVGLNENGLGETILAGKTEKLIKTENTLEGHSKWTVLSMPNLDGIKKIAEQEAINETAKQKLIDEKIQSTKQLGDKYITDKFGAIIAAGIGQTTEEMNKPLALSVKNNFITPILTHVKESCNAISNSESYEFNLHQFTTDITEFEITTEAGL